jgi:hypothetical protein
METDSFDECVANYRQRIRAKFQERGVPEHDLDRQTDELMRRPIAKIIIQDLEEILRAAQRNI